MMCTHCHQDKQLDQFCKNSHTKSGVQQPCKSCFNVTYTRANRQKAIPLFFICRTCGQEKPMNEFHPNKRYRSGYSDTCEVCFYTVLPTSMICSECGIDKPLEEYARYTRSRLGYQQPCTTCRKPKSRQRYRDTHPIRTEKLPPPASMSCNACGIEQSIESFPEDRRTPTGYGQPCLACINPNRCTTCHEEKPSTEFRQDSRYRSGHHPTCKDCRCLANNAHRLRNKVHINSTQRKRYAINPEKHRSYAKTWRASDPQHLTQEKVRASRRRARLRNLPATFTIPEHTFMMQYWHFTCIVCGNEEEFNWTIAADHWIPISSPDCPGTIATNMIPLCHTKQGNHLSCNSTKYNRDPVEWLTERVGARKAQRIFKAIETYFALVRQRQASQEGAAD